MFAASLFGFVVWLPFSHYTGRMCLFCSLWYSHSCMDEFSSQISRVQDLGKRLATCYLMVAFAVLVGIPISGLLICKHPTNSDYSKFIEFTTMIWFVSIGSLAVSRYFALTLRLCIY